MKKIIENNIERWFDKNQLVKEIYYYNNGQKRNQKYYLNGKKH